jgi:N-acetylglucosamine kinase-like BadF-type ATPase
VFSSNRAGKSLLSTTYALPFSELGTTAKLGKDVLGCVANLMNHIADNDETEIADSAMRSSFCVDPIELYEDFQRVRFSGGNLAILRKTSDYADILFRLAQRGNLRANQLLDETSGHLYKMARRQIIELELDKSDFSILFQGTLFDKHPAMARHLSNRLAGEFVMGRQVDSETCLFTGTIGATLIALSEQREGFSLCDRGRALLSSLRDANLANNEVVYWNTIAVHTGEPV